MQYHSCFCIWVILHIFFLSSADFFHIRFFKLSGVTIRVSNSLDQDLARRFVGPDLDPNCLQMLSADDTKRQSQEFQRTVDQYGNKHPCSTTTVPLVHPHKLILFNSYPENIFVLKMSALYVCCIHSRAIYIRIYHGSNLL